MKLCPNCGAEMADEVRFCTQCGVPMTPEETSAPAESSAPAAESVQQPEPNGTIQVPDPFEAPLPTIEPDEFIDLSGFMDPEPLIIPGNALPLEPETIEVKEKYYFKDDEEEEEEKKKRPVLPWIIVLILAIILFVGAFAVHILGDRGEEDPEESNAPGVESVQPSAEPTPTPTVGDFFGETEPPAETTPAPTETLPPEETKAPEETQPPVETTAPETQAPETQKPQVVRVKSHETGSPYTVTIESGVYVRTGPSTDYEICGVLSHGDTADVVRIEKKWAEINYQGYVSYVYAGYLTEGKVDVSKPTTSPEPSPSPSPDNGTRYYMGEAFTSDYVLADSATRLYTEEELSKLSTAQLKIARNEIYARYGRKFTSSSLQSYFNACSWYKGTIEAANFNDVTMVNDVERANANLMLEIEQKRG